MRANKRWSIRGQPSIVSKHSKGGGITLLCAMSVHDVENFVVV